MVSLYILDILQSFALTYTLHLQEKKNISKNEADYLTKNYGDRGRGRGG